MESKTKNNCYFVEPERKCCCNARPEVIVVDSSCNNNGVLDTSSNLVKIENNAVDASGNIFAMSINELILYCDAFTLTALAVRIPKNTIADLNKKGVHFKPANGTAAQVFSLTRNEFFMYAHLFKVTAAEVNVSSEHVAQLTAWGVKLRYT